MVGLENVVGAIVFTVISALGAYVSWEVVFKKEVAAATKRNEKLMQKDRDAAVRQMAILSFVTGFGFTLLFEWSRAGLAAYGIMGGALLGSVLWVAFPWSMHMIAAGFVKKEKAFEKADLFHWLLALVLGGLAISAYYGL